MRLGERIRRERKDRKMSQDDVAELLGVGQPTISRWENGDRVDATNYAAVARFLEITEADVAVLAYEGGEDTNVRQLGAEVSELRALVEEMRAALAGIQQGGPPAPPEGTPSRPAARKPQP